MSFESRNSLPVGLLSHSRLRLFCMFVEEELTQQQLYTHCPICRIYHRSQLRCKSGPDYSLVFCALKLQEMHRSLERSILDAELSVNANNLESDAVVWKAG
eukprot:1398027-Amphidinium_carterae.1